MRNELGESLSRRYWLHLGTEPGRRMDPLIRNILGLENNRHNLMKYLMTAMYNRVDLEVRKWMLS